MGSHIRRIPPRKRNDFTSFLKSIRIDPNLTLSNLALLAYSEGKLPSDGFSFVHTFEDATPAFEIFSEVAGYRHYASDVHEIYVGFKIQFVPEPENEYDENAIKIIAGGIKIGYVNRIQAK